MENIIVGFSKMEQCNAVREIVISSGFLDITVCQSGAEIVRAAQNGAGGVVILALKLKDMMYQEVYELLPKEYDMLVLLNRNQSEMLEDDDIFSLVLPVNKTDLIKTVKMVLEIGRSEMETVGKICYDKVSSEKNENNRTDIDKRLIEKAKLFLMNKYSMTEDSAHRFLQKGSMDNGLKMIETARIVLNDEMQI